MARLWAEAWTRPGDAAYGVRIADLPLESLGGTQGYSGVYSGNAAIPSNYPRLNEILYTDGVTPGNGVWSTIKVFSDSQSDPIFEFLPDYLVPAQSKSDTSVKVSGFSIDGIMGFARVEPWDWDGNPDWVSRAPDWIWGGSNLLGNPGFEDSPCRPEINSIEGTATGGTFTLSDGTDTTSALTWPPTASTVETEIETDITAIDDVNVTGTGTAADPLVIEFVSPCNLGGGLIFNGAGLTGGTAALSRTQFGALQPSPWTKSQEVSSGNPIINGDYTSFRVTTAEAHSGTFSLLVDPAPIGRRFAGAQQVVPVQIGMLYQASVWVKTNSSGQEYRFVLRGADGDLLLDVLGNEAVQQLTLASGVWTQFSIPNVAVGNNERIIFRIANINVTGNPAIFYVDDGIFSPGLAPTTVGSMFQRLYNDATINHVGRVVWEDEAIPGTTYLNLDFDAALDSDGVAWDRSDVSLTIRPRMTYVQVLEAFVNEGGYEWRVIADYIPGYYLLQLFNPGTLGATMPAGIQGGSSDISHNARYFAPNATDLMVQGQAQVSSRAGSAGLQGPFGLIEGSELDMNITSLTSAGSAAVEGVSSGVRGAEALVYTLRGVATEPLVRYRAGDTISIEDPPIVSGTRRVSTIEFSIDSTGVEYTVSLGSEALLGQTAVNHAVGVLLKKFERADDLPAVAEVDIQGGGGMMTVAVAAANASSMSQSKADFVCAGTDDQVQINEAIQICADAQGGTVWLSEGTYDINGLVDVSGQQIVLRGLGIDTILIIQQDLDPTINLGTSCWLLDMTVRGIIS